MISKNNQRKKEFNQEYFKKITNEIHCNSELSNEELFKKFNSSPNGLTKEQVDKNISTYGKNDTRDDKNEPVIIQFFKSFLNAFVFVLVIIGIITYLTSIAFVPKSQQSWSQIYIIVVLILVSGIITFTQEFRSEKAAESLRKLIKSTCFVKRDNKNFSKIDTKDLAVGDIVKLQTGDIIPADLKILECKDFFVSQSTLTGEAEPIEKHILNHSNSSEIGEYTNICLLGTNVVSGTATAIVIGTGENTYFGAMQDSLQETDPETNFDKSVKKVSKMLLKFMAIMVPLVQIGRAHV